MKKYRTTQPLILLASWFFLAALAVAQAPAPRTVSIGSSAASKQPAALPASAQTPDIVPSQPQPPYATVNAVPPSGATATTHSGASKAEIDRQVMSAVEEVLMRHGNPPYAEIVTNDPAKAEELRHRLNAVQSGSKVREEISILQLQKKALDEDVRKQQAETARLRMDIARLHRVLASVLASLTQAQRQIEEGGYKISAETPDADEKSKNKASAKQEKVSLGRRK